MKRTEQEGHDHDVCPECSAELCGGLIIEWGRKLRPDDPEGYARSYGWPEHLCGSRMVGIEDPRRYDGVSWWLCPDCGTRFDRWTGKAVASA